MGYDYIKSGQDIYDLSFRLVREQADLSDVPEALESLMVRLIHAVGMADIMSDIRYDEQLFDAAMNAFAQKAPILCDCDMVANGITKRFLPKDMAVESYITHPQLPALATQAGTTRSAAQIAFWQEQLEGAIIAIGNAPTALFHLLEVIEETGKKPACILGFPVGFVGAKESKEALIADHGDIPYVTIRGTRGGSALAAAAVNALALEAAKREGMALS